MVWEAVVAVGVASGLCGALDVIGGVRTPANQKQLVGVGAMFSPNGRCRIALFVFACVGIADGRIWTERYLV